MRTYREAPVLLQNGFWLLELLVEHLQRLLAAPHLVPRERLRRRVRVGVERVETRWPEMRRRTLTAGAAGAGRRRAPHGGVGSGRGWGTCLVSAGAERLEGGSLKKCQWYGDWLLAGVVVENLYWSFVPGGKKERLVACEVLFQMFLD